MAPAVQPLVRPEVGPVLASRRTSVSYRHPCDALGAARRPQREQAPPNGLAQIQPNQHEHDACCVGAGEIAVAPDMLPSKPTAPCLSRLLLQGVISDTKALN